VRRNPLPGIVAGLCVMVLALTACGTVKNSSSGGSNGELTLWTHNGGNPAELAAVNTVVNDFNASQSKYKVKLTAFPQKSYNDAVVAAATAKKLPCILDMDAPIVPNWAWAGYLSSLNLPQDMVSKQLPSTLGKYKDKLYAVGYYEAALAMYVRTGALQAAGVRVPTVSQPWTAAEFTTALQKIKASGKFQYALDLGTGDLTPEWWTYAYSPFMQSFGGDLVDRSSYRTADGFLNGDGAMTWANWFQSLIKNGYTPAKSGTDAFADFLNGKSAMVWSGIWNASNAGKVPDVQPVPPPDFGKGPKIGGGSWEWGISSSCGNQAAAQQYLQFSLNPKYLAKFATDTHNIPATDEAAAMSPGWQQGGPNRFFLDESKAFALIRPPTPGYPFITTTYAKMTQDLANGGNAKSLLDQAVKEIDANLKTNNYYGY
jgi:multiple sugar transport system substrate-binding protein